MERGHAIKLRQRLEKHLKSTRLVRLDLPDRYPFMDPALVALLESRVARHLR